VTPRARRLALLGLAAGVALAAAPVMALAEQTDALQQSDLSWRKMFTLLFLMLGPIKILGPFVHMTRDTDATFRIRLATRAVAFSAAALLIAGALGRNMLDTFDIPVPVLSLTGGLVLFLVALQTVLEQFSAAPSAPRETPKPTLALAFSPLAFPVIVTPYGIAATIIFTALPPGDMQAKALLTGAVATILALDWMAMLFAHTVLKYLGVVLQVFAVVLGINQVTLGLFVMLRALSNIGLFTMTAH
jgi:multiple antibiotic resistance protein